MAKIQNRPMGSPLSPGTKLGRYEIRSQIGVGGMGEVYLAHDPQLDRTVALKILPENVAADRTRLQRFVQEAKSASALNHPNILTVYEIGEAGSTHFIAAEYIEGETLRHHLSNARMTLNEVLDICIQVTTALATAHKAGIIHRDMKPENIMIRQDGIVKVLDFGLAKLIERFDSEREVDAEAATEALVRTEPGVVMGTATYMSPEQARGKEVDARTDIFSLGAVIYEMLSGRAPFAGETSADIIGALIHKEPQPLSTLVSNTPAELQHIVSKALRKDRDERYQTVKSLLVDLKTLKQELDFSAKLERSVSPDSKEAAAKNSAPAATSNAALENADTQAAIARPTSTAEYMVSRIKQHKGPFAAGLAVLLLAAISFGYQLYTNRASNAAAIESIAVLPFINESGNAEVEYLSDGMTESLINSLSQLPSLSVKARSSVFRYKGKNIEPQQVASELSVQAILNGRVVHRGDDLTLYLSLVDARNGNQLWGERYDRKLADLISLQREVAHDVSQKLRARLSGAEQQKVTKDYTANTEAYQLYLKGRFHMLRLTPLEAQKGISYFEQAIEIDPNYALAYVGISGANRSLALGSEMNPREFFPKAMAAAQKAISIDDGLAESHTALGASMFWYDWNWNEAENHLKRALELDPNSSEAHGFYAHLLSLTGRHAEALAEIKRSRELDPFSPFVNAAEGQFLVYAGKPDEALARLREAFELAPPFWFPHLFASSAYIEKGMFAEAIAEARRATELSATQTGSRALEGYALAKLGKTGEARDVLDKLLKLSKERFVPPYHIASLYNGLGDQDQAFKWLERGFEQRDPKMVFLKVEPKWNNVRDDPRFTDLMRRVGL